MEKIIRTADWLQEMRESSCGDEEPEDAGDCEPDDDVAKEKWEVSDDIGCSDAVIVHGHMILVQQMGATPAQLDVMAAAPEMLDALEGLESYLGSGIFASVQAVIKKARGEDG